MPFRGYSVQRQAEMFVVGDSERELQFVSILLITNVKI